MTELAINLLMERLLWPVPRVRAEVCRQIAGLVRNNDPVMQQAFLSWLRKRELESEVALAVSIIDAFDLARHFSANEVIEAIQAPSLLSDLMLRRNFNLPASFHSDLSFAPDDDIIYDEKKSAFFDRNKRSSVPGIFETSLLGLESRSGLPFVERWRAEWLWLQENQGRPLSTSPTYFSNGKRDITGQFDIGQREIYVSAFLRCLAFSVWAWRAPRDAMERQSDIAFTLNRGLADVIPRERPAWSFQVSNLLQTPITDDVASEIISLAKNDIEPGHDVLALRLAEDEKNIAFDIRIEGVISPKDFLFEAYLIAPPVYQSLVDDAGNFCGALETKPSPDLSRPTRLSSSVWPSAYGRLHGDLIPHIMLPDPAFIADAVEVAPTGQAIKLASASQSYGSWEYWYAHWRPVTTFEIGSTLCYRTQIEGKWLANFKIKNGLGLSYLVKIKVGRREESYLDFTFSEHTLIIPA